MSRNEIFLLLASVFAVAIMSGPKPLTHSPSGPIFSLASATGLDGSNADATMLQHSFDHQ